MTPRRLHRIWLVGLIVAATCAAQTASHVRPAGDSIEHVLELARAHRYREASAAIRTVPVPGDPPQRIKFFRIRASIESGLGHSRLAADYMEAAAKLAPQDTRLQAAASLARLEAHVEAHEDPSATLKALRSIQLPSEGALEVRLRTGEVLSRGHLYAAAAEDFAEAARLAPSRADIFFNLALARYYNGQWDAALESANRARALENNGATESLLGDIEEKRGDSLAAVHSYQAAVALEPNVEQHRLALATELLRHQTFDAAIVVLEQASDLFPQSVRVKVLLGLSYYLVDRTPDSVRTLITASQVDQDGLAQRYLGEITLQDSASPDPAAVKEICGFADAHPQSKTANAYCGGAMLRVAQENADTSAKSEILRRLQAAVRVAPEDSVARCQLGKALEWAQMWQEARVQQERCVRLAPNSPEGHYRMARIYRRLSLPSLANQQTILQEKTAKNESDESIRRANSVSRFLVLLDH